MWVVNVKMETVSGPWFAVADKVEFAPQGGKRKSTRSKGKLEQSLFFGGMALKRGAQCNPKDNFLRLKPPLWWPVHGAPLSCSPPGEPARPLDPEYFFALMLRVHERKTLKCGQTSPTQSSSIAPHVEA